MTDEAAAGMLAENVVAFARVLRRAGMPVGPGRIIDAMQAVSIVGITNRADFYWTLHALFVGRREHRPLFDAAFTLFWRSGRVREEWRAVAAPGIAMTERPRDHAAAERRAAAAMSRQEAPPEEETVTLARRPLQAMGEDRLRRRDFAQMSADELAEATARIARLALPDDEAPRRRMAAAMRGQIDPRRSFRSSLRTGGGMILPAFQQRRTQRPPIVVLADISGSMGRYSRILLHFVHALAATRRVETFLFGTRLSYVTRELRLKDPDAALAACAGAVPDWSGGTRIATAIENFNRLWSRRVLGQGAIVLLVTDGLERDAGEDLGPAMDRLHRSCRRLIWLNPLLRFDGFEARAHGIRAMLPHVDSFLPVHSLEAVGDLVSALEKDDLGARPVDRYLQVA